MTLSTQTPGNQTLKRGDGFIFHDVFGRVAVDRGNDDIRDPEGNRTVPIVGVTSSEMQATVAAIGEASAEGSLPVATRVDLAITVLWDEGGFVRAEELFFEPARAWRMFRLIEEAEALGERGSFRLRDLAGMVCGVNDGDGDGVPNLCDTCPTVPGTDASGGVRTAPGIAISMVERRWRRSFGESGSCLGSSPQTSARRWIVTAMLV